MILEDTMSKEPLAGAVAQGDSAWADAVRWVVFGLIQAESGVTSANVQEMLASEDPTIRRLLGVEGELGRSLACPMTSWSKCSSRSAIMARSGIAILDQTRRLICARCECLEWTNGGLLYSMPFGRSLRG